MKIDIPRGKYVLAVSGGVDSMVLLELLRNKPGVKVVVAHFDHGMRADSPIDAELVRKTANKYNLDFELGEGNLGKSASEAQARAARYKFLNNVKDKKGANYIATAHHQDDFIETALINILRGSGRRGMSAIIATSSIKRPLINYPKAQIVRYAKDNNLIWREDHTNDQDKYLRNYLRKHILVNLSDMDRQKLLQNLTATARINLDLDSLVEGLSEDIKRDNQIDRQKYIMLPQEVADELMLFWLRNYQLTYDKNSVNRLSLAVKTAKAGTAHDINKDIKLIISQDKAMFSPTIS